VPSATASSVHSPHLGLGEAEGRLEIGRISGNASGTAKPVAFAERRMIDRFIGS